MPLGPAVARTVREQSSDRQQVNAGRGRARAASTVGAVPPTHTIRPRRGQLGHAAALLLDAEVRARALVPLQHLGKRKADLSRLPRGLSLVIQTAIVLRSSHAGGSSSDAGQINPTKKERARPWECTRADIDSSWTEGVDRTCGACGQSRPYRSVRTCTAPRLRRINAIGTLISAAMDKRHAYRTAAGASHELRRPYPLTNPQTSGRGGGAILLRDA
jgi:hypothetical protein